MSKKLEEALKKIDPINALLASRFGIKIEDGSVEHMLDVLSIYEGKRELYLKTLGEAQALQTNEYAKAVLISEAVKALLREIAPKRLKRRKIK